MGAQHGMQCDIETHLPNPQNPSPSRNSTLWYHRHSSLVWKSGQYLIGQWTGSRKSMTISRFTCASLLPALLTPLWYFIEKGNTYRVLSVAVTLWKLLPWPARRRASAEPTQDLTFILPASRSLPLQLPLNLAHADITPSEPSGWTILFRLPFSVPRGTFALERFVPNSGEIHIHHNIIVCFFCYFSVYKQTFHTFYNKTYPKFFSGNNNIVMN